ncbi:hypothetical protein ABZ946_31535 [Streptomyces sp. NPDC046324]|uniref:hypothetical protein n=1 Tax=Streptomyces sp. NPDC046324 TaxID=3154915 RepID=UPI0033EB776A
MKTTGYGRSRYDGRLPGWLRGLVVLAAGWGVLFCGQQVAEGYGETMVYRDAPVCEVGSQQGSGSDGEECVRREAGTVLDRRTGEHCTSNGSSGGTSGGITTIGGGGGMATAGGSMGGVATGGVSTGGGGGGTTCTRYYDVEVEWPDRTAWLAVGSETYDEVKKGDRAEVRLWRGEVVGLEVRGRNHAYAPSSQSGVWWWLALGCLILAGGAWGVVSGRLSALLAFPNFGWPFVAAGVAWLGAMALFGGHLVIWGFAIVWTGFAVFWIVSAWRFG